MNRGGWSVHPPRVIPATGGRDMAIKSLALGVCAGCCALASSISIAQTVPPAPMPQLVDPALAVRVAAEGFELPIGIAFPGYRDWFVIEKNTGRVQRVVNGQRHSTVLDLSVNGASERGLLGIALH